MEKVLQQILEELKSLREGQETQGQRLERVENRLQALEQGQESLGRQVNALQQGQESLGRQVNALQQGQKALRQGQEALRSELQQARENLQNQIARLEVRLETEAFGKIGALFDGFQLHREILERIEKKLEAHDARLDLQENEITFLRSRK